MPRSKLGQFLVFCSLISLTCGQNLLIRPFRIYENLIRNVYDHFHNGCIVFLHSPLSSLENLDVIDELFMIQRYFSTTLSIHTSISDLETFTKQMGCIYRMKRPLFILLNDDEGLKVELAQVSSWISMSYPTWLIFLRDKTNIDEFLVETYIPYDSMFLLTRRDQDQSSETITEAYRIAKGEKELKSLVFGSWNIEKGFETTQLSLFKRRHDLYGHVIRVAIIHDAPLSVVIHKDNGEVDISGTTGDFIKLLERRMNSTFAYVETETRGVRLENGSWTGIVKMLLNDEIDIGTGELMMTSDRLKVITYSTPIYASKTRVYVKRPDSTAVKWSAYLTPFQTNIWRAVGLSIIGTSGTIKVVKALTSRFSSWTKDYDHSPSGFLDIIFNVFGAFCSQGMESSSLDPVRLVHLIIHTTGVIIAAAYSAALISSLTIKNFAMPFTTMEGLLEDGTYRFSTINESSEYTFFQNSKERVLVQMFQRLLKKETDMPHNFLEGFTRVCTEDKYSFLALDNAASLLAEKLDCYIEPLDAVKQTNVALGLPQECPYLNVINSNIFLMRDSGVLQRLLTARFEMDRPVKTWTTVELDDVLPLLIFMALGFFISSFIFIIECLMYRRHTADLRKE